MPEIEKTADSFIDENENIPLASADWTIIQCYVEYGSRLPTSVEKLRKHLNIGEGETYDDFAEIRKLMLARYDGVKKNCMYWKKTVYPDIVALSDDIVDYARKSDSSYKMLRLLSDQIGDGPFDTSAKECTDYITLFVNLSTEAKKKADRAQKVLDDIEKFLDQMKKNKLKLADVQEKAKTEYNELEKHCSGHNEKIIELEENIEAYRKERGEAIAMAVTKSANCAINALCFTMIIPIGLAIWQGIEAGVDSAKAEKLKKSIDEALKLVKNEAIESQRRLNLMNIYQNAQDSVSEVIGRLSEAKTKVEGLQGIWRSVDSDLSAVVTNLTEGRSEEDAIWRSVNYHVARDIWQKVEKKADYWRMNAYITVEEKEAA